MSRSIFKVKKIKEETLGGFLRQGRESQRLSLEQVASNLVVSKTYLEALEENNFSELPPEIYVKGIICRYAKFLELDEKKALFLYQKRRRKFKKLTQSFQPFCLWEKVFRFLNYRNAVFLAGILLFGALVLYLAKIIYPLFAEPYFSLVSPASCPFDTGEEKIDVVGKVMPEGKVWINGEESLVDKDGNFSAVVFLKEEENLIKFKIENKFKKVKEVDCLIRKR